MRRGWKSAALRTNRSARLLFLPNGCRGISANKAFISLHRWRHPSKVYGIIWQLQGRPMAFQPLSLPADQAARHLQHHILQHHPPGSAR